MTVGRKGNLEDPSARRFVRILREEDWEKIMALISLPQYGGNFNLLFNDLIGRGLPILERELKSGSGDSSSSEQEGSGTQEYDGETDQTIIIRLLREINVNININKSLLSSLFNAKELEVNGSRIKGPRFTQGAYGETPSYLKGFETRGLMSVK